MNKLDAYKMDGLGNDFIIFDKRKKSISLTKKEIIKISDRKNIGCDQVIFINNDERHDAYLTFFNSDGGEIAACGNGTRCVADLLIRESNKKNISLKTKAGILEAELSKNDLIRINMGQPIFNWKEIPLSKEMNNENLKIKIISDDGNETEGGFALSIGNPHVIFFIDDYENYNIKNIGPKLENHNLFPKKCNVTFAKIIDKDHIKVKVWERGAGLTKACGTAACATTVASSILKLTNRTANVEFSEGMLNIEWSFNNNIWMSGKVSTIKEIKISF